MGRTTGSSIPCGSALSARLVLALPDSAMVVAVLPGPGRAESRHNAPPAYSSISDRDTMKDGSAFQQGDQAAGTLATIDPVCGDSEGLPLDRTSIPPVGRCRRTGTGSSGGRRPPASAACAILAVDALDGSTGRRCAPERPCPVVEPSVAYAETAYAETLRYIDSFWPQLTRATPEDQRTLMGLPRPYVVPGVGTMFQEMYYWDSFFTALGLIDSAHEELVLDMTANMAWLLQRFGMIPNGTRYYFLSRSQPPFFTQMVTLAWRIKQRRGDPDTQAWLAQMLALAEAEHATVWHGTAQPHHRLVHRGLVALLRHQLPRHARLVRKRMGSLDALRRPLALALAGGPELDPVCPRTGHGGLRPRPGRRRAGCAVG